MPRPTSGSTASRQPKVASRGEVPEREHSRNLCKFAPALLIALLLVLAISSGCGVLPTPVTAQPSPSGSLVMSFTGVGQGDGVLVQSTSSESYLLDAGKAQAGPKVVDFSGVGVSSHWTV